MECKEDSTRDDSYMSVLPVLSQSYIIALCYACESALLEKYPI